MPGDGEKEPTFQEKLQTAQEELEGMGQARGYEPDRLLQSHSGLLALIDEGIKSGELEEEASIELKLSVTGTAKAIAKKKGDDTAAGTFDSFESTFKVMRDLAKKQGSGGKPKKRKRAQTSAAKSGRPKSKQDT